MRQRISEVISSNLFLALAGILGVIILAAVLWLAVDVVLIVFTAILFAIVLRAAADFLCHHTPLSEGWALFIVVTLLVGVFVVTGIFVAPSLSRQFAELSEQLPQSFERLRSTVLATEWGKILLESSSGREGMVRRGDWLTRITGAFTGVFGVLASVLVVLVLGVYLAISPETYRKGFEVLFPDTVRKRVHAALGELKKTLKTWLLARLLAMFFVGLAAFLGLVALDVPLALVLGLIAALLDFIPNFGPLLAFLPAGLLALAESPQKALSVGLLYAIIQLVEGNVVTPLLEKKTLCLPPALGITAQLLAGVLFGAMGLVLATPMTLVVLVVVNRFYLREE